MPIVIVFLVVMMVLGGGAAGCAYLPQYNVYSREMEGKAQLAMAESTRRTKVLEAQAIKDSAAMLAEAEVIRAEGVAKANRIIADGLGGADGYLRYLYIDMLRDTAQSNRGRDVIYVPTEGALPVLEAGKRPSIEGQK